MSERRVEWPTLTLLMLTYLVWGYATTWGAALWLPLSMVLVTLSAALHSSLTHEAVHGHPTRHALLNEALEVLAEARTAQEDQLAALVSQLPPNLSSDDQMVIVTTHDSVRLDPSRFGLSQRKTPLGDMLSQAVCISVNDPEFSELFELEDPEQATVV